MLITICGPSGAGKTELSHTLKNRYDTRELISYTTRTPRPGEAHSKDYYFIDNDVFSSMIENGDFCEYEEYSQNRLYGTGKKDVIRSAESEKIYVTVVTPNGMRAIEQALKDENVPKQNYMSVMVTASLGVRVKRYIDRVGSDNFNYDDMNEINARVNRDFGMFLNMERNCDLVLDNSCDYRYDTSKPVNSIAVLAEQVIKEFELRKYEPDKEEYEI